MTDTLTIISLVLVLALTVFAIIQHRALKLAAAELAALRNKPTLVPNPALNHLVDSGTNILTGETARLRKEARAYRDALADIHASTEKGQNGTARMINRKVSAAFRPEQRAIRKV